MGNPRPRSCRLAEKLLEIRFRLELSQSGLLRRLGADGAVAVSQISAFESGKREPSLPVLLLYARLAGVPTDVLIDDELDLPERLPLPNYREKMDAKFSPRGRRP